MGVLRNTGLRSLCCCPDVLWKKPTNMPLAVSGPLLHGNHLNLFGVTGSPYAYHVSVIETGTHLLIWATKVQILLYGSYW